jgi:uncharacterized protein (DUF58 family)
VTTSCRDALLGGSAAGANFVLSPPRHAPGGTAGLLLTKLSGNSLDFREHRDYHVGDDVRQIDWNVFARSDQLTVKVHHDEMSPHLDLLLDTSRSMALAGSKKSEAALALSALLATAAGNGGFSRSVWLAGESCDLMPDSSAPPSAWNEIRFDCRGTPAASLARHTPNWKPFAMRILVSDLLWLGDPDEVLRPLAHRAAAVVVIQLLAESDLRPGRRGNFRLVDSETSTAAEVLLDDRAVRRYADALRRHEENWSRAVRQLGGVLVTLVAEEFLDGWRVDPLARYEILQRKGKG